MKPLGVGGPPRSPASERSMTPVNFQDVSLHHAHDEDGDDDEVDERQGLSPLTVRGSAEFMRPDCGPVRGTYLFSYRKAHFMKEQQHPGERVEVEPGTFRTRPYSLRADLGNHVDPDDVDWLWRRVSRKPVDPTESSCCQLLYSGPKPPRQEQPPALLARHGLGIVLYFKWLKYMSYIFGAMAVLSLPALIMYTQGSAYSPSARQLMMKEDGLAGLFFTTLGSLGESSTICQQGDEGTTLGLVCPNGVISSIAAAYYGNPKGACHCPASQRPTPETLSCPASHAQCSVSSNVSNSCFPYLGMTTLGEYCCAAKKLPTSYRTPDLSTVNVAPDFQCNSATAQSIARGMCLGKANCTLAVAGSRAYTWLAVGGETPTDCTGGLCSTNFQARGNFTQCGQSGHSLILQATCRPSNIQMGALSYKRENVVLGMACMDAFGIVLFLFALYYLGKKERRDGDAINGQVCTAADYTLKVTGLPPTSNISGLAKELQSHFEGVLSEAQPAKHYVKNIRVADVNIARSDAEIIKAKKERGAAARSLDRARGELRLLKRFRPEAKGLIRQKELQVGVARASFEALSDEVEELTAKYEDGGGKVEPVAAFVTFEEEEGVARALRTYRDLGVLRSCLMPKQLRFYEKALKVERAAEPASILWENMVPPHDKPYILLRRLFTVGVSIVVLVLSFGIVWKAQEAQTIVSLKYPQVSCAGYKVDLFSSSSSSSSSSSPYVLTKESVERDVYWDYYQSQEGDTGKLQCFCRGAIEQQGLKALHYRFADPSTGETQRLCTSYIKSQAYVTSLLVLASFAIVLVNCALQGVLRNLTAFERHASKAEEVMSLLTKLFVVSLSNTAFLSLLTSANLTYFFGTNTEATVESLRSSSWSFFHGPYGDFTEGWYRAVGVSLVLTMIINIFGPHVSTLVALFMSRLRRFWDRGCGFDPSITRVATQKDLDALYIGPPFELEERYSQGLTTIFVTLLFSGGMPLLLPVAALAFALTFWVDKLAFFRLYRAAAPLNDKVARLAGSLLPYAALLHLGFAAWAVTSPSQFSRSTVTIESSRSFLSSQHSADTNNATTTTAMSSTAFALSASAASSSSLWGRLFYDPKALPLVLVGLCLAAHLSWRLVKALLGGPISLLEKSMPRLSMCFEESFDWQGLDNYFAAIPTEKLEYACSVGVAKPEILARYQQELERRRVEGDSVGKGGRVMEGLPSYEYACNNDYLDSFALDSDAIVTHETKKRRTGAGGGGGQARRRGRYGGVLGRVAGFLRAVARLHRQLREAATLSPGKKQKKEEGDATQGSQVIVQPPPSAV